MKHFFTALLMLLVISSIASNPMVHREGPVVIDTAGNPLHLNGVNLGGWLLWEGWIWGKGFTSETRMMKRLTDVVGAEEADKFRKAIHEEFITEKDVEAIGKSGFNSVRVPFNHTLLEDDSRPKVYKPEGWKILDSLLYWCEKYHVYVVLDLHGAPGGQNAYFISDPDKGKKMWNDPVNIERTVSLWKAIAERYKSRKIIAGYDLLNEPSFNKKQLVPIYKQIIAAIRQVDLQHMIILEGHALATDMTVFTSLPDDNCMLSFHMYTWFGDKRLKLLEKHSRTAKQLNVPMWVGEYGENNYDMLRTTLEIYAGSACHIAGWCFWTWKKAPNRYPGLNVITLSSSWTKLISYLAKGKNKPSRDEALKAMQEFIEAFQYDKLQKDEQMRKALMAGSKQQSFRE